MLESAQHENPLVQKLFLKSLQPQYTQTVYLRVPKSNISDEQHFRGPLFLLTSHILLGGMTSSDAQLSLL